MSIALLFLGASILPFIAASPALPTPTAPPSPTAPTKTYKYRRDILSSLAGDTNSILSELGSAIPSYVASGVPNFFQDFPTGTAVQSSLSLESSAIAALPTQVLNIPGYGNWTNNTWSLRFHGNVYKQPNISNATLDDLANNFLVGTNISSLPESQQEQARNLTAEIYVLQQGNVNVTMSLSPAPTAGSSGQNGGGGGSTPNGGSQEVTLPYPTTDEGDFDVFVPIKSDGLTSGDSAKEPQRLNVYAQGASNSNATSYLVPEEGLTIVSDIDDILRVTQIYQPKEGLLNSFARPFVQLADMPDIYSNWSTSIPGVHFHYLTTTPEQVTRNYMDFIYKTYPGGSFDTRPLNFSNVEETLSVRKVLLQKVFETYPKRKFVLVADTSNSDVMKDYPEMVTDFPNQVSCILLRNTSATDPSDKFPYDTSGFQNVPNSTYMFFVVPDDLKNIDLASGGCRNASIAQNVTFGYQGLPFSGGKRSRDLGLVLGINGGILGAFAAMISVAVLQLLLS